MSVLGKTGGCLSNRRTVGLSRFGTTSSRCTCDQTVDNPKRARRRRHVLVVFFRFILHCKKTGFVVEHDFIMATYLADRVIVFDGKPSVDAHASEYVLRSSFVLSVHLSFSVRPQALVPGMNSFLKQLEITFRRDPENARPRINKKDSVKVTIRAVH